MTVPWNSLGSSVMLVLLSHSDVTVLTQDDIHVCLAVGMHVLPRCFCCVHQHLLIHSSCCKCLLAYLQMR